MKKIGIYPGNFQPPSMAHFQVYKKLKSLVGNEDVFVATTDRDPIPEAPLNFGDKQQIWSRYGVPITHIIKVNSLPSDNPEKVIDWRPEEIYQRFSKNHTAAIVVINEKELFSFSKRKSLSTKTDGMSAGLSKKTKTSLKEIYEELGAGMEKKEVWLNPNGSPQYFQPYKGNEHDLKSVEEHAYVVVLDDTKIQGKPVSTTNIRSVLGSKKYNDNQKKKFFRFVFGWFDQGLYQLMVEKFKHAHQVSVSDDEPSMPAVSSSIPKNTLEEMVIKILKNLEEDYSSDINTPDSSDNLTSMADTLGQEKSPAEKSAEAAKNKIDLSKEKASEERTLKGMESDLKWKQNDILRKRKDELPNQRKKLDAINKQISNISNGSATSV